MVGPLLLVSSLLAVEPIEVTGFVGITKRGVFAQPSVDDLVRGFPRVEFQVRHNEARNWQSATVLVDVSGTTKKGEPIRHTNTFTLDRLNANSPAFWARLPQSFANGQVTSVAIRLVGGVFQRSTKTILAKARLVSMDKEPLAEYEDDYLTMRFKFVPERNFLSVELMNRSTRPMAFHPTRLAVLEFDLKDLPGPLVTFEERYPLRAVAEELLEWAAPNGAITEDITVQDRKSCTSQQNGPIEIEPDPQCKNEASPMLKYSRTMQEGYALVRAILPVRFGEEIRQYVFTFVLTMDATRPRKRNPEEVIVKLVANRV